MTDRIVIEGQMIRHIRESVISEAPFDSLEERLTKYKASIFPVLPSSAATRYIEFDPSNGRGAILLERGPQLHTIAVQHRDPSHYPTDAARVDDDGLSRFKVQLPYTYWLFPFQMGMSPDGETAQLARFTILNTFMLFRREAYRHASDTFQYAAVPNVDSNGGVCWGSTVRPQDSFSAHLDAMVNEFFTTTFNEDLGHRSPFNDNSLTDWETASAEPLSYISWPLFEEPGITMEELRERYLDPEQRVAPPNIMDLNPAYIAMPELPENFTVAAARQWLERLDTPTLGRITAAMQHMAADAEIVEAAEEATA